MAKELKRLLPRMLTIPKGAIITTEKVPLLHECGSGGQIVTYTHHIEIQVGGTSEFYDVIDHDNIICINLETGEIVRLPIPGLEGV